MLAEIIGHDRASAEAEGSSDASASTEAFACGPAECSGLAQQLLALILELLGALPPSFKLSDWAAHMRGCICGHMQQHLSLMWTSRMHTCVGRFDGQQSTQHPAMLVQAPLRMLSSSTQTTSAERHTATCALRRMMCSSGC